MPPNGIRFSRSREAAVGWKRGLGAAPLQLLEAGGRTLSRPGQNEWPPAEIKSQYMVVSNSERLISRER